MPQPALQIGHESGPASSRCRTRPTPLSRSGRSHRPAPRRRPPSPSMAAGPRSRCPRLPRYPSWTRAPEAAPDAGPTRGTVTPAGPARPGSAPQPAAPGHRRRRGHQDTRRQVGTGEPADEGGPARHPQRRSRRAAATARHQRKRRAHPRTDVSQPLTPGPHADPAGLGGTESTTTATPTAVTSPTPAPTGPPTDATTSDPLLRPLQRAGNRPHRPLPCPGRAPWRRCRLGVRLG